MLSLFPRLLKFRTAPLLSLSPYQDISESDQIPRVGREGWLRGGEWPLRWRDVDTWDAGDNVMKYSEDRGSGVSMAWCHMGRVLSPGCGHLMTVSVIMVIIVIMIHDTNLSLSRRVRHTTTGHQPHITQANLVTGYWKIFGIISDTNHCILSQPAGGIEAIVRSL